MRIKRNGLTWERARMCMEPLQLMVFEPVTDDKVLVHAILWPHQAKQAVQYAERERLVHPDADIRICQRIGGAS